LRFAPGSNVSFETDPTNNILTISSTGGSGSAIVAKDEGNTLTSTLTSLNFVGPGVTATSAGNDVTVNYNWWRIWQRNHSQGRRNHTDFCIDQFELCWIIDNSNHSGQRRNDHSSDTSCRKFFR